MIYELVEDHMPIRQGDIFYPLPIILPTLGQLAVMSEYGEYEDTKWDIIQDRDDVLFILPFKKVWGIVATQDCDASRSPVISLFEIGTFKEVTNLTLPEKPPKWVSLITQKSRLNARWFYLPADEEFGFKERMAVNFHRVFQIQSSDLKQSMNILRKGRLVDVAYQHYRESIAHYFKRYPYDEWYSLTKEEFDQYNQQNGGSITPFAWQD
ncbi:hypothetical protein P0O24_07900 [Methanotrichaceae archaeon M04Ac]|uniref:Uncharacterized protein n=1 Tax=Candidatus Methanocrinis alkalitolerans TaxID=3033395 RepID=A0ABT5XFL6_9EURY|nr:hypothetical protein [Candidatus Methanocrinis alkalitolerans]MCR3884899.1 hypothetical protein [Methanothrix sp.]MDF0593504.1 hypothetical protein [Candidatus Methanocrinis alkalitolerans]